MNRGSQGSISKSSQNRSKSRSRSRSSFEHSTHNRANQQQYRNRSRSRSPRRPSNTSLQYRPSRSLTSPRASELSSVKQKSSSSNVSSSSLSSSSTSFSSSLSQSLASSPSTPSEAATASTSGHPSASHDSRQLADLLCSLHRVDATFCNRPGCVQAVCRLGQKLEEAELALESARISIDSFHEESERPLVTLHGLNSDQQDQVVESVADQVRKVDATFLKRIAGEISHELVRNIAIWKLFQQLFQFCSHFPLHSRFGTSARSVSIARLRSSLHHVSI